VEAGEVTDKPLPRVERDPDDDHPLFFHECTGVHAGWSDIGGKLPLGPDGWQWQEDGSLRPSIQCLEGCGTHGFWDGPERGWRPA
jgi:hypothetical protein